MSAVDGEARDRLAKVIYEYTPLMTVIQDAHRIADAILAAGWVSREQVAEIWLDLHYGLCDFADECEEHVNPYRSETP